MNNKSHTKINKSASLSEIKKNSPIMSKKNNNNKVAQKNPPQPNPPKASTNRQKTD
jgi:hypothetical protein